MNRKGSRVRLSVGAISIFMIFVILVMTILAILSFLRVNSYYQSTLRQVEFTSSYYQSESRLLQQFYQLNSNNIEEQLSQLSIDYHQDNNNYIIEDNINDNQILQLTFTINGDQLEIISFKTVNLEGEDGS